MRFTVICLNMLSPLLVINIAGVYESVKLSLSLKHITIRIYLLGAAVVVGLTSVI